MDKNANIDKLIYFCNNTTQNQEGVLHGHRRQVSNVQHGDSGAARKKSRNDAIGRLREVRRRSKSHSSKHRYSLTAFLSLIPGKQRTPQHRGSSFFMADMQKPPLFWGGIRDYGRKPGGIIKTVSPVTGSITR